MLAPYGKKLLAPDDCLALARDVMRKRFAGAECGFAAGSLMRGEGTLYSDLDLVVLYRRLDHARRETIRHKGVVVELFIQDPETARWFMREEQKKAQKVLIDMIATGVQVPTATPLAKAVQAEAHDRLTEGPAPADDELKQWLRYGLTSQIEDLCGGLDTAAQLGCGADCLNAIGDIALRQRGQWTAHGKWLLKSLAACDRPLARRVQSAFRTLFRTGEIEPVVALAEQVLQPWGGWLVEGYAANAKPDRRLKKQKAKRRGDKT